MTNNEMSIDYLWSAILGTALQQDANVICAEHIDDYLEAHHEDLTPQELERVKADTISIWQKQIQEVRDDFESFTVTRWGS